MQKSITAFEKRNVTLVGISVDDVPTSKRWAEKKGFTFTLASDPKMALIDETFHIRNPKQTDLAIHAIYIVDQKGKVYYRKVGRRRAYSPELLDAIDYHRGKYAPKRKDP